MNNNKRYQLINSDCLEALKGLPDNSIDSIVTDPPYGLSFMGKKWDYDVPTEEIWRECFRVLKPGGHLLAFAGTRTQHRMAVRIEDAGFEIRDMIAWVYGSGFPKSLDVSKAIDKAAGAEREKVRKPCAATAYSSNAGNQRPWMERAREQGYTEVVGEEPATDAARQWQGWGTALKPALEPITVARKPLIGTVAENVLQHGTGGLNIDGCRVELGEGDPLQNGVIHKGLPLDTGNADTKWGFKGVDREAGLGRFPANFIHDGAQGVLDLFPKTGKDSAARFFYCAKTSTKDRNEGLEGLDSKLPAAAEFRPNHLAKPLQGESGNPYGRWNERKNNHPTVKPTDLMRYLCRLVTPPGGTVLDPFMGSGSTGKAAMLEGFNFIGMEMDPDYCQIAEARIQHVLS